MSHNRVENLPFTTYDLVGYLVPGTLPILYYLPLIEYDESSVLQILNYGTWPIQLLLLTALVIFSYIVGHIISYLSSEISEKFVLHSLGYPTNFLLVPKDAKAIAKKNTKKIFEKNPNKKPPVFTRCIFIFHAILFFPILILYRVLGFGFYSKSMSSGAAEACRSRFRHLWPHVSVDFDKGKGNWFELVSYYTLNRYPYVAPKAYNYVVLYGLLRCLFFMSTLLCWGLLVNCLLPVGLDPMIAFFGGPLTTFGVLQVSALLWGIAYCKYYRRYSREILSTFAATYVESV